jgi:Zn-dependent protease with chaperone function
MSDSGGSSARASVTALVGVLAAVGLLLVMITWAATLSPGDVVVGGREPSYSKPSPTAVDNADSGVDAPDRDRPRHELLWLILTVTAFGLAGLVVLAVLLSGLRWLLTLNWRRRRERDPQEVAFDTLDPPALGDAVTRGAARQRTVLSEGSPRNAIVACWHLFEQQAATVGVHRASWETSSEFTLRVLDQLSADPAAVTELADLYRDARHSRHEITEQTRQHARAALDRIFDSLATTTDSP